MFFELLNVSNFAAKLLQKPIYIQILRFIFALRKLLVYRRFEEEKFICGLGRFICGGCGYVVCAETCNLVRNKWYARHVDVL